jgi:hypothetical protein
MGIIQSPQGGSGSFLDIAAKVNIHYRPAPWSPGAEISDWGLTKNSFCSAWIRISHVVAFPTPAHLLRHYSSPISSSKRRAPEVPFIYDIAHSHPRQSLTCLDTESLSNRIPACSRRREMAGTPQPSILAGAHANLPRGQGMPKFPTASLYPPDRLPTVTDFNPEWSDWK